jgi:hypothetical protein
MSRLLLLLACLAMFALPGCARESSPEQTLLSAMDAAHNGDLPLFLSHFEPVSRQRLGLFWTLSTHYGYLRERALEFLEDLAIEESRIHGDRAQVMVKDSKGTGALCLVRVDGQWLIDLLGKCSGM